MPIQSSREAVKILQGLIRAGTVIRTENPKDKGWRGKAVELLLGHSQDSRAQSDSFSYELKVSLCRREIDGTLKPKEGRVAITMVDEKELLSKGSFQGSRCWNKLQKIILVGVSDTGDKWSSSATMVFVRTYAPMESSEVFRMLSDDYGALKRLCVRLGFDHLSRSLKTPHGLLHIGTKGARNSTTRAFFLTNKGLDVLPPAKE